MKIKKILMIYQSMSIPVCKLFKKLELDTKLDIYLFITDPDFDSPRLTAPGCILNLIIFQDVICKLNTEFNFGINCS
jgi:hypothetical protein